MVATLRVFALLGILQERGWVPGPELARRLEVDGRLLRRDLERLGDLGFPIESRRGRHGGYRLKPGYRLPPLMLDEDEATATVVALATALRLGLGTSEPAIASAGAKIRRVLPTALRGRVEALEVALGFAGPERGVPGPVASVLLDLAEAMRLERCVTIRYRSPRRGESVRAVDAYGIAVVGRRWYLVGLDHRSGEPRTFRVDRIERVSLGDEPAPIPPGFDAVATVSRSLARVPWRWEVEVVARASADDVRRDIPSDVAELVEEIDGTHLHVRSEDLEGSARMLAAMPWPFTIISPPELREALRAQAERLLDATTRPDGGSRPRRREATT
jgi:predicted DNA-binding transcriptional regulator YafY